MELHPRFPHEFAETFEVHFLAVSCFVEPTSIAVSWWRIVASSHRDAG